MPTPDVVLHILLRYSWPALTHLRCRKDLDSVINQIYFQFLSQQKLKLKSWSKNWHFSLCFLTTPKVFWSLFLSQKASVLLKAGNEAGSCREPGQRGARSEGVAEGHTNRAHMKPKQVQPLAESWQCSEDAFQIGILYPGTSYSGCLCNEPGSFISVTGTWLIPGSHRSREVQKQALRRNPIFVAAADSAGGSNAGICKL